MIPQVLQPLRVFGANSIYAQIKQAAQFILAFLVPHTPPDLLHEDGLLPHGKAGGGTMGRAILSRDGRHHTDSDGKVNPIRRDRKRSPASGTLKIPDGQP